MNRQFYVIVAGSRSFEHYMMFCDRMNYYLKNLKNCEIHIITGGAIGADSLAIRYAKEHNYPVHIFPANWNNDGLKAGYIRNRYMHEFFASVKPENKACICFWDGKSKGTAHNFELCKEFNTPLRVVRFNRLTIHN